jgi:hypothetical protein
VREIPSVFLRKIPKNAVDWVIPIHRIGSFVHVNDIWAKNRNFIGI